MVRPLLLATPIHHHHHHHHHHHLCFSLNHAISLIFAFMSIFTLVSIFTFLCASHENMKPFKPRKPRPSKFQGFGGNIGVSGKALLKMVSWQRVHDDDDEEEEKEEEVVENEVFDEDVVWRKTIIMGGRCRPLEFSGKIEYDCDGNPLPVGDDNKPARGV